MVRFTGFLGDLRLGADEVRADTVGDEGDTRQVAIVMNEEATAQFALFTRTHVNQSVSMFVCGLPVETSTVQAPIETGYAITGPIESGLAAQMVDALNGLQDCPG